MSAIELNPRARATRWRWFHRFGSPAYFYAFAGTLSPWLGAAALLMFAAGLPVALYFSPIDYQQGHTVRIMYIHVPNAMLSIMVYLLIAACGIITLVWRMKITEVLAAAAAPLGAAFTFVTLATGSLWGKPMWGTWWAWDARLTSELVLLFLYLGYIALYNAYQDRRSGARAAAILAIVGVVNIPIIKYSVEWWTTLHQPSSSKGLIIGATIDPSMRWPLYLMLFGFLFSFAYLLLQRARNLLLLQERHSNWVKATVSKL